jgi:hypothetical protein
MSARCPVTSEGFLSASTGTGMILSTTSSITAIGPAPTARMVE